MQSGLIPVDGIQVQLPTPPVFADHEPVSRWAFGGNFTTSYPKLLGTMGVALTNVTERRVDYSTPKTSVRIGAKSPLDE
jgi:hypothetical protein